MIILKSNYQFALLGSIGAHWGTLLRSNTTPLELIGYGSKVFNNGPISDVSDNLRKLLRSKNIRYKWSDGHKLNGRGTKLLIIYKTNRSVINDSKELYDSFNRFIINAQSDLNKIACKEEITQHNINHIEYWFSSFFVDLINNHNYD